jgi:NAD(P)H-hydrate epimerase
MIHPTILARCAQAAILREAMQTRYAVSEKSKKEPLAMRIVTVEQMRAIEAAAEHEYGLSGPALMAVAGKSAADTARAWLGGDIRGTRFLMLIGPGNNGGDGNIMAQHLIEAGAEVVAFDWQTRELHARSTSLTVPDWHAPEALAQVLPQIDVVVDAFLGIGVTRPLSDAMAAINQLVRDERLRRGDAPRIIAIDLPSGMDGDTGAVSAGTLAADLTITLGAPKIGLFWYPGAAYLGELRVGGIGLPAAMAWDGVAEMVTPNDVTTLLPGRPDESNKGTYGKTLIVAGSPRFPGAALMAATAAARSGAGLVTIATTPALAALYVAALPEATYALLPDDPADRAKAILAAASTVNALLIGPGLDQEAATRAWFLATLAGLRGMAEQQRPRLVVDADGLNLLSKEANWWTLLPPRTILTPHPGEMARLLGAATPLPESGMARLSLLRDRAAMWGQVIVLKGAITTIVAPDGPQHDRPWFNFAPNPAMATAGMGDVLAGTIVGLLAQKMAPPEAAMAGVALHSAAGRRATEMLGDARAGLLAMDVARHLPQARAQLQPFAPRPDVG